MKTPRKPTTQRKTAPARRPARKAFDARLLAEVRDLIEQARQQVSYAVNAALVRLNWQVGKRIREHILGEQRAEYGQRTIEMLARALMPEFGRGFTRENLSRMVKFAEYFPDETIVATLSQQLGWSHFKEILPLEDRLRRDFYAEMCRLERWSVRTLRAKIGGMLFERTAIAKHPEEVIRREIDGLRNEDQLTPDLVFRDPYLLDFLGLTGAYSERDLEQAILRELESFLLELGTDFTFAARQKRITVDDQDYYLDLLFYHRRLRRLVAVELKLEPFQAADKGQMELYLRWLQAYEMHPHEEPPIGLILCAGKREGHVRLLQLEASSIRVAQYLTELPPQDVLERKLLDMIRAAREQLVRRTERPEAPAGAATTSTTPPGKAPRSRSRKSRSR